MSEVLFIVGTVALVVLCTFIITALRRTYNLGEIQRYVTINRKNMFNFIGNVTYYATKKGVRVHANMDELNSQIDDKLALYVTAAQIEYDNCCSLFKAPTLKYFCKYSRYNIPKDVVRLIQQSIEDFVKTNNGVLSAETHNKLIEFLQDIKITKVD